MYTESNYNDPFSLSGTGDHNETLKEHLITENNITMHMGLYHAMKPDDTYIAKVPDTMAILVTSYEVKCKHFLHVCGRMSSDTTAANFEKGSYRPVVKELLIEMLKIKDTFNQEFIKLFPSEQMRQHITIRKNGHFVAVKIMPVPPIFTEIA